MPETPSTVTFAFSADFKTFETTNLLRC